LASAGITFEMIAGITAGLGAAAGFGIPLTSRNEAQSTTLITGHQCEKNGRHNWKALADLDSTLVFYMGVKNISKIVGGLVKNGKPGSTPLAIVQNGTMVSQAIFLSTLEKVEKALALLGKIDERIKTTKVSDESELIQFLFNVIPKDG
jgi:siroheme synthase